MAHSKDEALVNNTKLTSTHARGILWAIKSKQLASIKLDDQPNEANGLVLGADLERNEILISDTYPDISRQLHSRVSPQPFWLRIKLSNQYLCIRLIPADVQNGLITARILSAAQSDNKRWFNRVQFPSHQGPDVQVVREFAPNLSAKVRNLSAGGAAIELWGSNTNRALVPGLKLNCLVAFNRHFKIQTNSVVLSNQFKRSPSCHSLVRLRFLELDAIQHTQLINFLDATTYPTLAA